MSLNYTPLGGIADGNVNGKRDVGVASGALVSFYQEIEYKYTASGALVSIEQNVKTVGSGAVISFEQTVEVRDF